jgi:serine/threonine protein phosphatase PrpC
LYEIITRAPTMQDACTQLIQAANDHGGDDNITLILIRFDKA